MEQDTDTYSLQPKISVATIFYIHVLVVVCISVVLWIARIAAPSWLVPIIVLSFLMEPAVFQLYAYIRRLEISVRESREETETE